MALAMSTSTIALADDGFPGPEQDPYIFLEEARSPEALDWVAKENARTLAAFEADPRYAQLKAEALAPTHQEWLAKLHALAKMGGIVCHNM